VLMRWQAIIALLAVALILTLTGYAALQGTTVSVQDYGSEYVEGVAGYPRHVNPLLSAYNDVDRDLVALVFDGLTQADENGHILPHLAETWEVSADNLSYTFHLRHDVFWHDGAPFTADDVLFTLELLRSPDFEGQSQLSNLWRTVKVERNDTYTIQFTLSEPFSPFLHYTTIGLLPAHVLQGTPAEDLSTHAFNLQPVGTGPFQVQEITAHHAALMANPRYFRGRPYLERLELRFFADDASVVAAYRRGEVHGITRVPVNALSEILQRQDVQVYSAPLASYGLVFLNLQRPIFQQREVRQALLYALDRHKIIDLIFDSQAVLANSFVPSFSWAYESRISLPYDTDLAMQLLEQAGWNDEDGDGVREKGGVPLQFALLTNDDTARVQVINELTRQWAEVGIRAIPQTAGVSGIVRDFLVPNNYDALFYDWQELPTDPDPYPLWHSTQVQGAGQNYTGYQREDVDLLLEEARRTTDPDGRAQLYRQLQSILAEDVPVLPIYHPVYSYAVDRRVKDVQIAPLWQPSDRFRTVAQWYIASRRVLASEAVSVP